MFAGFTSLELFFLACAVLGVGFFTVRLVMLLFFGFGDHGADGVDTVDTVDAPAEIDGHIDISHGDVGDAAASAMAFKVMTMQGVTAFFGVFGLVGLGILRMKYGALAAFLSAGTAGVISMIAVSLFFSMLYKIQADGTMQMKDAVGKEGKVYLTVKPGEEGKVELQLQGSLVILPAVSDSKEKIETGKRVKVLEIIGARVLKVEII